MAFSSDSYLYSIINNQSSIMTFRCIQSNNHQANGRRIPGGWYCDCQNNQPVKLAIGSLERWHLLSILECQLRTNWQFDSTVDLKVDHHLLSIVHDHHTQLTQFSYQQAVVSTGAWVYDSACFAHNTQGQAEDRRVRFTKGATMAPGLEPLEANRWARPVSIATTHLLGFPLPLRIKGHLSVQDCRRPLCNLISSQAHGYGHDHQGNFPQVVSTSNMIFLVSIGSAPNDCCYRRSSLRQTGCVDPP